MLRFLTKVLEDLPPKTRNTVLSTHLGLSRSVVRCRRRRLQALSSRTLPGSLLFAASLQSRKWDDFVPQPLEFKQ